MGCDNRDLSTQRVRLLGGILEDPLVVLRVGTRAAVLFAIQACTIAFLVTVSTPGAAQQSARPQAPDLGSTERRFEALENEQRRAKNATVPLPRVAAPSTTADTSRCFRSPASWWRKHRPARRCTHGLPRLSGQDRLAGRSGGDRGGDQRSLPRRGLSSHPRARAAAGHQGWPHPHPGDRGLHRRDRRQRRACAIRRRYPCAGRREPASRRATPERQLLLVNDIPGIRIADTAIEEIGAGSGRFRLTVYLGNLAQLHGASSTIAVPGCGRPLQSFFATSFNSYVVSGDTFGINLSTIPNTPEELTFGRLFYNARSASTARASASLARTASCVQATNGR